MIAEPAGAGTYLVLQRKGELYPAITLAAYRIRRLPVWRGRTPVDLTPGFDTLEDAVVQAAFFSTEALNATLDHLLATAQSFIGTVRRIQDSSRPSFGDEVQEHHRADERDARQLLDDAITAFVVAARDDLRIGGAWLAVVPRMSTPGSSLSW